MTKTARKLDTEEVRAAASGRWIDILQHVSGLSGDILDGRHHPCPKCGGEDRFRLHNEEAGGILCNQCFAKKNSDGFAAVKWSLGVTFPEARKRIAEYLGMAAPKSQAVNPAKDLAWREWSSDVAAWYLSKKPGVTEAAMIANGARQAAYKERFSVIAWPIIGENLDTANPVGWVLANSNGGTLPKWSPDGEITGATKYKIAFGSKPGIVGIHAIERMKTSGLVEVVWKVEGISDLDALSSIIPEAMRDRHVVITNANGTRETPRWPAGVLAQFNTNVLHDADQPGQAGARDWSKQIAAQAVAGVVVRNPALPYEIAEIHGKDVRDYIAEGRTYADFLLLADQTEPINVARTATGEIDLAKVEYPVQELILKKLQLEVLYEDDEGKVRVFSTFLRKSTWIRRIEWLKAESMIQMCGAPAIEHISSDPDGEDTWSMSDVRKAISYAASNRRSKHDDRGIGVWQGLDDNGHEIDSIVLVNETEAVRWDGDVLRRIVAPRVDGLMLDFGSGHEDWFDFQELEKNLQAAAEPTWRKSVIEEACALFSKWNYKNAEIDPELSPLLMTGLVMASFIQTLWNWRPLVAIIGESNSGKSMMFEALAGTLSTRGLFGNLAFRSAKSSEAGIRQGIANTAMICMVDEFEKSKHREQILELFRASTRGETIAKGTAGTQKGMTFTLRHIGWIAATESGLQDQPDVNRFIQFDLLTAKEGQHNKLRLPEGGYLQALGQKLLAIAVVGAIKAKRLAVAIKSTKVEGIDPRTIESYSAPAAVLSLAMGYDETAAAGLLSDLLQGVDKSDQGRTDHESLVHDIISSQINCGPKEGYLTIGQILASSQTFYEHLNRLEAAGVTACADGEIFVAHRQVARSLLRDDAWKGKRIDQILKRIPGSKPGRMRIGGQHLHGIYIPFDHAIDIKGF